MKPHFHEQACLQAGCFLERGEVNIRECLLDGYMTFWVRRPHMIAVDTDRHRMPFSLVCATHFCLVHVKAFVKHSFFLYQWPFSNFNWSVNVFQLLLSGIYNAYEFEPPNSGGSEITHKDAPQSVGFLWTSDQPVAETSTWQHSQRTNIHAPGGIRTRNPSKRSAVDTRLRPLGH